MRDTLTIIELVTGIILTITILMQHRGTGLGGAFGGEDLSYRSRRGVEKLLYRLTLVSAAIFIIVAIAQIII